MRRDPNTQSLLKKTYNSLPNKPLLSPFSSSEIGVDGHTFCFDGIVHLNFSFDLKEGGGSSMEYEPVLVSKEMNSNIFLKQKLKINLKLS